MKRYITHILLLVAAALACILLAMWFHRDGSQRNVRWQPPKAQTPDFASMAPTLPERKPADTSRFLALLERPLFSPSRRPPPPPAPAEEQQPLPNVHLYGLYGGDQTGGAIVRVDGKNRRIQLNETISGWKLSAIGDRAITLRRGARTHTIELKHVIRQSGAAAAAPAPSAAPAAPMTPQARAQQLREERARQNAERAQAVREARAARAAARQTPPEASTSP